IDGELDVATREEAGRAVFGNTALVAVTLDPRFGRGGPFSLRGDASDALASIDVADAQPFDVARALAAELGGPGRSEDALSAARAIALERSITARRELASIVATGSARARVARARQGVFLVVVARGKQGLAAGAFPAGLGRASPGNDVFASALDGCAVVLE